MCDQVKIASKEVRIAKSKTKGYMITERDIQNRMKGEKDIATRRVRAVTQQQEETRYLRKGRTRMKSNTEEDAGK